MRVTWKSDFCLIFFFMIWIKNQPKHYKRLESSKTLKELTLGGVLWIVHECDEYNAYSNSSLSALNNEQNEFNSS